jgi:hypothetical protein
VKIDQSLVGSLLADQADGIIVKLMIELAHNLGFQVVAEEWSDGPSECPSTAARVLFENLEGSWTLSRAMEGFGKMTGVGVFRPLSPRVLEYREEGVLTLNSGGTCNAFRTLFYCLEGARILIRFRPSSQEGDILHGLRVAQTGASLWPLNADDTHHCGQDAYHGIYRFETPIRISIAIAVRGPKKNTLINTLLLKSAPSNRISDGHRQERL